VAAGLVGVALTIQRLALVGLALTDVVILLILAGPFSRLHVSVPRTSVHTLTSGRLQAMKGKGGMSNHTPVESQVLASLRDSGSSRPTALVQSVMTSTKSSRHEIRKALRTLVDRQEVYLNWHGELEPGRR
jgi:hypothetical protein